MKSDSIDYSLYAVTDRHHLRGRSLKTMVEESLRGGASVIQLREKDLDEESFIKEAVELKQLCESYKVPLIINDAVHVAEAVRADGVHVGQDDMDAEKVRKLLGEDIIIGVSVQTPDEALLAESRGADYLGVGAMFPTDSKSDAKMVSIEDLKKICDMVDIPVVAIGGINEENAELLKNTGIDGIAVISAVYGAEDTVEAAGRLKNCVMKCKR